MFSTVISLFCGVCSARIHFVPGACVCVCVPLFKGVDTPQITVLLSRCGYSCHVSGHVLLLLNVFSITTQPC